MEKQYLKGTCYQNLKDGIFFYSFVTNPWTILLLSATFESWNHLGCSIPISPYTTGLYIWPGTRGNSFMLKV